MGEIGIEKILLLLLIILLLFGAKRLPEFGRSLGKGIREFKGSLSGVKDTTNAPARSESADQQTREPLRLIG